MGNEASQSVVYGDPIDNNLNVSWKKTELENTFPAREGQCCCSFGNRMFIFGGVLHGDELIESNELLTFNLDTKAWQKVSAKGSIPSPRSAASLVTVGNNLYLFGGLSHECGWFNDLHKFDTVTQTWSVVQTDTPCPSPRDKLQGTVINEKIYYFGGFGPKAGALGDDEEWEDDEEDDELPNDQEAAEFGWFNDIHVFDTVSNKWSQPVQMNLGVPTPRAAHGMCSVGNNIVIFGGRDTEARRNDIHIFNTETRKWDADFKCKGRQPGPRSFHTATSVGQRVIVMGGRAEDNKHYADFHIFDTETKEWLQPKVTGDLPTGRGQHSVSVVGDVMVLYGGTSDFNADIMQCQKFHKDTYLLNTADILKGSSTHVNGNSATETSLSAKLVDYRVCSETFEKTTYSKKIVNDLKNRLSRTAVKPHIPMIKFPFRKPDVQDVISSIKQSSPSLATSTTQSSKPDSKPVGSIPRGTGIDYVDLPSRYQRKPITLEEMEYIERGGPE